MQPPFFPCRISQFFPIVIFFSFIVIYFFLCCVIWNREKSEKPEQSGGFRWDILNIQAVTRFFLGFFVFCLFRAAPMAYGGSQARGRITATAASLQHSHSNARSLTHWAKPGIEPETSWFLVRFVSAAPQRELLLLVFCLFPLFLLTT